MHTHTHPTRMGGGGMTWVGERTGHSEGEKEIDGFKEGCGDEHGKEVVQRGDVQLTSPPPLHPNFQGARIGPVAEPMMRAMVMQSMVRVKLYC